MKPFLFSRPMGVNSISVQHVLYLRIVINSIPFAIILAALISILQRVPLAVA